MSSPADLRSRANRFVRDRKNQQTVLAFAIRLFGAVGSFGLSYIIARHFGAAGTGSYALALTTAGITSTLSLAGLDYILLRTVAGDVKIGDTAAAGGTVRRVATLVASLATAMAVALALVGAPLLTRLLDDGHDATMLRLAALAVVPLAMTRVVVTSLRGSGSLLRAQFIDGPLAMLLTLSGLGILIASGLASNVQQLFVLFAMATAIGTATGWMIYRRRTRDWAPPAIVAARPLVAQSWRISLTVLSAMLADWLVLLVLGRYFGRVEVGQFRTAWQITALIGLVASTLDVVVGPRLAAAHKVGNIVAIRQIWRQSARLMIAGSLPVLVLVLAAPAWVLSFFGPEFVVAAPALRILALGQIANIATGSVGAVLVMTGREKWSLRLALLSLATLATTGLILIPPYGPVGAAIATALSIVVRNGTMTVLVRRQLRRPA